MGISRKKEDIMSKPFFLSLLINLHRFLALVVNTHDFIVIIAKLGERIRELLKRNRKFKR